MILLSTIILTILLTLVSFQGMIHTQALTMLHNKTNNNLESAQTKSLKKPQILIATHTLLIITMNLCRESPAVVLKCQEALKTLDILWLQWPVIVCGVLISFCLILCGLSEVIYFIGFLLLSQVVYGFAGIIAIILIDPHCQWIYPYQQTRILTDFPPCSCEN